MNQQKRRRQSLISIAAGMALGVLSLALPSFNRMWSAFGVSNSLRVGESTALAILFINLGFLIAVYFQQSDFSDEITSQQTEMTERLLSAQATEFSQILNALPSTEVFTYYPGEKAMSSLTAILPNMHKALNTRMLTIEANKTNHPALSPWDEAVRESVRNGLTFREVLSAGNEPLALGRIDAADGGRGIYEASLLAYNLPSFLNFIILEGRDGSSEVWFGWIVSRTAGYEGTVVRTSEGRIVKLFEQWHSELFASGEPILPQSVGDR